MTLTLVADHREHAVTTVLGEGAVVETLAVGDYQIRDSSGQTLAIFERKTLADLAASLKDGRCANVAGMYAMRAADPAVLLYYLVEGPAFPEPRRKFGRVPYEVLRRALTDLSVAGVQVVATADPADTASRLLECVAGLARRGGVAAGAEAPLDPVRVDAAKVWTRLPGIVYSSGWLLTARHSVREYLAGTGPADDFRLASGKAPGRRALRALGELHAGGRAGARVAARVLSGVRGVTPAVAKQLVAACHGLRGVADADAAVLAAVPVRATAKAAPRPLGATRADRILLVLGHRAER
jgi:hypothetical protein